MKILVVSQYYYPEPFRINEICEEFVKRGHSVTVLTANPNYPDGEIYDGYQNVDSREEINGVTVYRCKCRTRHKGAVNLGLNYIDFVIQANKQIMKLDDNFDCVYAYQLSPVTSCLPAIKYKKKKHIPMVLYCLDVWPESLRGSALEKGPIFRIMGFISKKIYSNADRLVTSSPSFCNYLGELCKIDPKDIMYLPQHSRMIEITQYEASKLSDYKKYTNFVFLGNIGESQNIECIIKAVSLIRNRLQMKVHIVGSGSHLDICKKESTRLETDDTILFHGRRPSDEMPLFYAIADVCIVSLKDEGIVGSTIPGKLQEYMSAGKAILGCLNGDAAEIIKNANCGYCVSANDYVGLARAMENILKNKEKLEQYGRNAKKYYQENFTLNAYVDKIENEFFNLQEV